MSSLSPDTVDSSAPDGSADSGFAPGSAGPSVRILTDEKLPVYRVERGKVLVICNTEFDGNLRLQNRRGTERDIERISTVFKEKFNFTMDTLHNKTATQMWQAIDEEARSDHFNIDCLVIFVLTHGKEQGVLYDTNREVDINKLFEPLKSCRGLAGKPKLVFIQACRGKMMDPGMTMASDAESDPAKLLTIPSEADFLFAHSTADGYVSFNNPKSGSWFIQALCNELEQNSDKYELMQMLTRVCHKISYDMASNTPSTPATHNLKQVSSVTTTLTKGLYFPVRRI